MLHKNITLGDQHFLQQWEPANAAARTALVVTASDVGKVARQLDTNVFYLLMDDSPMTWADISTAGGAGTVTSVTSANADATVATTTTTPVITIVQAPALRSATTTVSVSAATAPSNGQVLTATSSTTATWQTPSGGGGTVIPAVNGFRLTLTTGVPVTTSDVATATTIFCTPYKGNQIALFDGVSAWSIFSSSEFSLALGTLTANLPHDVFCFNNAGTPTLEFTAWTNTTTRATALVYQDGLLVKSGATTRRYLGTFHTISTTQTTDTARQRLLWNYYNRVEKSLAATDSTNTWAYSTAAYRQANASTTNQVEVMIGVNEDVVSVGVSAYFINSSATYRFGVAGIGLDSTTTNSANQYKPTNGNNSNAGNPDSYFNSFVGVGYHFLAWLEYGAGVDTQTWSGDGGDTTLYKLGMSGFTFC